MNKEIGILTYDYSVNYGAQLQAYALCTYIKALGYNPHIIRYAQHYYQTAGVETDNMKPFRDKYLPRTDICYTTEELTSVIKNFSRIIIGGDQVFRNWAPLEEQPIFRYFGDFVSGTKTLASYGASFGIEKFEGDKYTIKNVRQLIKRFDKIGVREKSGVDLLKNDFFTDAKEVLDPVFLLDRKKYEKLTKKCPKINENYIAYMYLGDDFGLGNVRAELQTSLKDKNIININKNENGDYNTVEQWLCNMLNANFVITDSFHCVAFAIIFQKPFIVVNRDFGGNSRLNNILEKLKLSHCKRNKLEDITLDDLNLKINWEETNKILKKELINSKLFLDEILKISPRMKEPYIIDENLQKIRHYYERTYLENKQKYFPPKKKDNIIQKLFSVKNEYSNNKKQKIFRILGVKLKFKIKKDKKMQESKKYTTIHYLAAILKNYNITNAIISPGTQNACFNLLLQHYSNIFNLHSVVDERSAAYVATGISEEIQQPVIITCTGATASRNYLSALTEAYYRKLPIIAVTFFNYTNNEHSLGAQFVDRSVSQNDIKTLSVELPVLNNEKDKERLLVLLNTAITTALIKKMPVHINCPSPFTFEEIEKNLALPDDFWTTEIYNLKNLDMAKGELKNKNVAIFIGSHEKFSKLETETLSNFAVSHDAPIFCDHTSNYKGANKILVSQAAFIDLKIKPDIVIDIGNVSGEYATPLILGNARIWRVAEYDNLKCRYNKPVEKFFNCTEQEFFTKLTTEKQSGYYSYLKPLIDNITIPVLPLSMPLVCSKLAEFIPQNSTLHLAILNALRGMNYFTVPDNVDTSSNVGGFGIDGALSTVVGHSIANPNKTHFCIIGDLAFFYDMNILGNRHIGNNLKIIVVNNNRGEEFRLNWLLEKSFGNKTDDFVAAAGHYKNGVKLWAESCDFEYLSASTKSYFEKQIHEFCIKDFEKPAIFEVFTTDEDEKNAQCLMMAHNKRNN